MSDEPPAASGPYRVVLVGTDGSDTASRAVRRAGEVAAASGARLIVAFVGDAETGPEILSRAVAAAGGTVAADTRLVAGDPADALLELAAAERADLIVVGNKGMSGAQRFLLGSVPNKVSHRAHCDVLVAHTTG